MLVWTAVALGLLLLGAFVADATLWRDYVARSGTSWLRESVTLAAVATALATCVSVAASNAGVTWRRASVIVFAVIVVVCVLTGRIEMLGKLWARNDEHRAFALVLAAACGGVGLARGASWFGFEPAAWLWRQTGWLIGVLFVAFANAWLQLFTLGWLVVLAAAIGTALTNRRLAAVPFIVCVGIGLVVMALATLALGLLGFVRPWATIAALVATSVYLRGAIDVVLTRASLALRACATPRTWAGAAMHAVVFATFAIYLVAALAPETGGDALAFRLAAPLHWSASGSIDALPQMLSSYGVCAAETLDLLGLPLAGPSIVKLLQWACAVLLLLSARRDVLRHCSNENVQLWLYPFFASTVVWWQFAYGFNDTVQLLFAHCALLCVVNYRDRPRLAWLFFAGLCSGGAAATKVNGGLCFVLVMVMLLFVCRPRGLRACVIGGALAAVGFGLGFGPWSLRTLWLTGNPVFPFANGVFGSPLALQKTSEVSFGLGTAPLDLVQLPTALFYEPQTFVEIGMLHPSLLFLMPLCVVGLLLGARRSRYWAGAAVVAFALWAFSLQNLRYGLLFVWCATLAMIGGLDSVQQRTGQRLQRVVVAFAVALALAGGVLQHVRTLPWMWARHEAEPLPAAVVFGAVSEADYLADRVASYRAAEYLNARTDKATRVWQLPRHLGDHTYFRAPVTAHPHGVLPLLQPMHEMLFDRSMRDDLAAIHARLVELGYSHLMYRTPAISDKGVFSREFAERYLDLVHAHEDVRLYEVLRAPIGAPSQPDVIGRFVGPALPVVAGGLYVLRVPPVAGDRNAPPVIVSWYGPAAMDSSTHDHDSPKGPLLLRTIVAGVPGGRDFCQTAPQGAVQVVLSGPGGFATSGQVELLRIRARS